MFLTAEIRTVGGESLGLLVLKEKVFKSGRKGFFGQGKISLDGQRFQSQCSWWESRARPRATATSRPRLAQRGE